MEYPTICVHICFLFVPIHWGKYIYFHFHHIQSDLQYHSNVWLILYLAYLNLNFLTAILNKFWTTLVYTVSVIKWAWLHSWVKPEPGYMRNHVENRILSTCRQSQWGSLSLDQDLQAESPQSLLLLPAHCRAVTPRTVGRLPAKVIHYKRTTDSNFFSCLDKGLRYATWVPEPNASWWDGSGNQMNILYSIQYESGMGWIVWDSTLSSAYSLKL